MAETENQSAVAPEAAPPRDLVDCIVNSAFEAFGSAFIVWILGGIALGIAGGFAGDMVPSWPPGFVSAEQGDHHAWWQVVKGKAFGIFFAIFFVHSLWVGFRGEGIGAAKRMERILAHLREHWFGLIVGNAISAWVAVLILEIMPSFSLWRMLMHWVWGLVFPLVHEIATFLLGASSTATLGDWISWYDGNQMKLTFWLIYISSAFDDMGVPNLKTLARWLWRRIQKRTDVPVTVSD